MVQDDDDNETRVVTAKQLAKEDATRVDGGRARSDDDEAETRIADRSQLIPDELASMDLEAPSVTNEDSLTLRRQGPKRAPVSFPRAVPSEPTRIMPPQAPKTPIVPATPIVRASTPPPAPRPVAPPPNAPQQAPPRQAPLQQAPAQQPPPPRAIAVAPLPSRADVESAPIVRAPPIFVTVMTACVALTVTGLALLFYLHARHLW